MERNPEEFNTGENDGRRQEQARQTRSPEADGEDYEIRYLAEKIGISPEQARELIARHSKDHEKLIKGSKLT